VALRHDELSRIGLFRGSEGQQGLRMMREQTSAVKDLHREVQNLSATVKQFMSEAAYTGPATSSF
jgi:heme oxygenase